MPKQKRFYRKKIAMRGLLFFAGVEMEITVRNISITGILIEVHPNDHVRSVQDIFEAINNATTHTDIYLPDLRLAGEAEIVWAEGEAQAGTVLIGLEFKSISYDVDNLVYKRKAYRKALTAPGQIVLQGRHYTFMTRNVSVEGLMAYIPEHLTLQIGEVGDFVFDKLSLRGQIRVVWFEYDQAGGTVLGLQYVNMENLKVVGIPRFAQ